MGDYSDVALCLTKTGAAKLATAVEARVSDTYGDFASNDIKEMVGREPAHKDMASGTVAFCWTGMKWYADFEEVAFVENFMADLEYEDYYFIRVGEDYNDIEVNGGFWDNSFGMRIERRIVLEDAG